LWTPPRYFIFIELGSLNFSTSFTVILPFLKKSLISALKPVIKKLIDLDFRLKPELVKETLTLAEEE